MVKDKGKKSLVLITYRSEGLAPCILIFILDGGECLALCPTCITPHERTPTLIEYEAG
jgi:hypothetical protein